jgi:hypothetical protein
MVELVERLAPQAGVLQPSEAVSSRYPKLVTVMRVDCGP